MGSLGGKPVGIESLAGAGGGGGPLAVGGGGRVNPTSFFRSAVEKFRNSPLNGFVPRDGARWGITKGTPEEWARLATATAQQESGFNANAPGGGLLQMRSGDLARYGVHGNVNDPNAQLQGMVNQWSRHIPKFGAVSEPGSGPGTYSGYGGAGAYFGSMRGRVPDVAKYLGKGGFADQVAAAAGPGRAPHFNVADIRKSLEGTGAGNVMQPGVMLAATGQPPEAFIMHHTGGRGSIEGVQATLRQRGLGVEYPMDREGNIRQIGGPGAANILPGWGKGDGLNNKNIVGMEVIARNNRDVTKAQIESGQRLARELYPNTPFYGHGEVNPGHKEADEGMAIVGAIRAEREHPGLHGQALRSHFGHRAHPDLLGAARQSGLVGAPMSHKVEGSAHLKIDLAGFPRGTTTRLKNDGELFKTVQLSRGRAMPPASQQG
jgi:hypothetical protein